MKVHFIGIGGIGVSALAQYYLAKGYKISGSDLVASEITDSLKKLGAKIFIGEQNSKCSTLKVEQPDLVVYSPAVQKNNPELKAARLIQHPRLLNQPRVLSYPEALGELTKQYFTIAISGTHGKSTTTAMLGLLLVKAGLDPTVIVGTKLKEFGNSNFRLGKMNFSVNQRRRLHSNNELSKTFQPPSEQLASDQRKSALKTDVLQNNYLVIEADEYMSSFLNYWPKIIVLTNIEEDHLDYYKNLKNIIKTFRKYVGHLPKNGILIINKDDLNIPKIFRGSASEDLHRAVPVCSILSYSIKQAEAKKLKKILKIPGEHNIYNALAALTVARTLKIPDKISFKTLSEYRGSWRRFEVKQLTINNKQVIIVNDYGHHPTEIRVTLKAVREKYPKKKIWCVFQPHQCQRTYYLFNDFVKVFKTAPVDKIIITDIYDVAGRETPGIRKKVSSEKLVEKIKKENVIYLKKDEILDYLKKNLRGRKVVVIMGAGDIYQLRLNSSS